MSSPKGQNKVEGEVELRRLAELCFEKGKGEKFTLSPARASREFLLQLVKLFFDGGNPLKTKKLEALCLAIGEAGDYQASQITRLLEEAGKRRLAKIIFEEQVSVTELAKRYNLKEVRLCKFSPHKEDLTRNLGLEAARLFEDLLEKMPEARVALGGGRTLFEMVQAINERDREIVVIPTSVFSRGEIHPHNVLRDSPFLTIALTWKSRCSASVCAIPALSALNAKTGAGKFTRQLFEICPSLGELFDEAAKAMLVFTGASNLEPNSYFFELHKAAGISEDALREKGCIGHMNFGAMDANGNDVLQKLAPKTQQFRKDCHPFLAALNLEFFKRASSDGERRIVMVAGGLGKVRVIRAALKGNNINCLVTDEETARMLLREENDGEAPGATEKR